MSQQDSLPYHCESTALLAATPEAAFSYLDDPKRLGAHMGKSSWMMAGSHMDFEFDEKQGREEGSIIILKAKMLGIPLFVKEAVLARTPPVGKNWQTTGPQKLIVMDQYRMGFELSPQGKSVLLRVFIDYSIPATGPSRWLALALSRFYAQWCTDRMAKDAETHFKNNINS